MKSVHKEVLPIAKNNSNGRREAPAGSATNMNRGANGPGSPNMPGPKIIPLPPKGAVKKPTASKKRERNGTKRSGTLPSSK